MNFYFKNKNYDFLYLEAVNKYNLAYWIAADADYYYEYSDAVSETDRNNLINQFNYGIDLFHNANDISKLLSGDHKTSLDYLQNFVKICMKEFNFMEGSNNCSETREIELLEQINHEKKFHNGYLYFMNTDHADYLIMKAFSYVNDAAADLMLIDFDMDPKQNKKRAKSVINSFLLAVQTIDYALDNINSLDGIAKDFEIINQMRSEKLSNIDFLKCCDKNVTYMKIWKEFFLINKNFYEDTFINNKVLDDSEYDFIQFESKNYQAQINLFAIEIIQNTLDFMNIHINDIEIFSKRMLHSSLGSIGRNIY